MEKENLYRPVEEVEPEGSFRTAVCFKPKKAPFISIAIGVLFLIPNNLILRLLASS